MKRTVLAQTQDIIGESADMHARGTTPAMESPEGQKRIARMKRGSEKHVRR
jgi:hypothetical protein